MRYLHYDLGSLSGGEDVEVILEGNAANVLLLDSMSLLSYRRGGRYSYYGGYFERSPAVIGVPHAGHWHIIVDLPGGGHVQASVEVFADA